MTNKQGVSSDHRKRMENVTSWKKAKRMTNRLVKAQ